MGRRGEDQRLAPVTPYAFKEIAAGIRPQRGVNGVAIGKAERPIGVEQGAVESMRYVGDIPYRVQIPKRDQLLQKCRDFDWGAFRENCARFTSIDRLEHLLDGVLRMKKGH